MFDKVEKLFGGVVHLIPKRFEDERGYFSECYNKRDIAAAGITESFCQDNHAYSKHAGTVRGFHFQLPPFAQAKLVRCTVGRILDVVIDIRLGSPTYGKSYALELSAVKMNQIYVPVGFAHAYYTLESDCEVQYKVSEHYNPDSECGINALDPALDINWPEFTAHISERDSKLPQLSEISSPFIWNEEV